MNQKYQKIVGTKIRYYRKAAGFTQEELAKKAGLSVMSIRRYESGERVVPPEALASLAKELNVSKEELGGLYVEMVELLDDKYDIRDAFAARNDVITTIHQSKALEFAKSIYARDIISAFELLNERGKEEAARSVNIIAGNPVFQRKNTTEPADPNTDTTE